MNNLGSHLVEHSSLGVFSISVGLEFGEPEPNSVSVWVCFLNLQTQTRTELFGSGLVGFYWCLGTFGSVQFGSAKAEPKTKQNIFGFDSDFSF